MCGIAGIYAYHHASLDVDREELRRIRDHMAARGPDGKGEWYAENGRMALGHRRLSIIDLSERGAQPMASADGTQVVTFNGEIYNYRALRQELEAKGHIFRSDSDTEVLLHLYTEKGAAMVHDLRGMFAFALWDANKRALLMARDPYGIKPLYYADDGWTLRFASQVKALQAGGRISSDPEPAGIVGFYLFGSVPEPYTLYQEVRAVPAGSYLWVDEVGPREPVPYFSLAAVWREAEQNPPLREQDKQEVVREALLDSVRHHMVADVPVGAFLSAGIDSGALVGLMQEVTSGSNDAKPANNPLSPQKRVAKARNKTLPLSGGTGGGVKPPLRGEGLLRHPPGGRTRVRESDSRSNLSTITLAFEEYQGTHDDEAPTAAQVSGYYGTQHKTRTVSESEFAADLPRILEAMDQPSIDGINTWFVSKAAHEAGLKVAVSGLGGDELFGGYPSFRDIPRWVRLLWLPGHIPGLGILSEQVQSLFAPLFSLLNPKAAGMLRYGGSYEGAYLLRRGLFLPRELPNLMDPALAQEGLRRLDSRRLIRSATVSSGPGGKEERGGPKSPFGRVATLESGLYMRNQLLRDTDWSSMAHSLEVRVPLVDAWLVRSLAKWLVNSNSQNQKSFLARSPRKPLLDCVTKRAKSGFTTPITKWQQQVEGVQTWRSSRLLARDPCPWARRWSYAVAERF